MKFVTTKEDYNKALAESFMPTSRRVACCLIAQTIHRVTGKTHYRVGENAVWPTDTLNDDNIIPLPENARSAVKAFDRAVDKARSGHTLEENEGFTETEFELPL